MPFPLKITFLALSLTLLTACQSNPAPIRHQSFNPPDASGKDPFCGTWPSSDPKIAGTRVALNFLNRPIMQTTGQGAHYAEACTGYGALRFAQSIDDHALANKIVARYATILTPTGKSVI